MSKKIINYNYCLLIYHGDHAAIIARVLYDKHALQHKIDDDAISKLCI